MKKFVFKCLLATSLMLGIVTVSAWTASESSQSLTRSLIIHHAQDIPSLFPKTVGEIEQSLQSTKDHVKASIQKIISIPSEQRTFENTVLEFDRTLAYAQIKGSAIAIIEQVHPDQAMREKAQQALLSLINFSVDLFETNQSLYGSFKQYIEGNAKNEDLNGERQYYLANQMMAFRKAGLELDDDSLDKMKQLQKQISALMIEFSANIAQDDSSLSFSAEALTGLDPDFLNNLKRDGEAYIVGCEYPTRSQVMNNCSVESTRRDYSRLFLNRAFPKNVEVLKQLINSRDDLALLLGYKHFAECDLESEMTKTCKRVESFLQELALEAQPKAEAEWNLLFQDLPESVALTAEGQAKPWDVPYLNNYYMKKHLNVDQDKIAEYFPMEPTIQGLLNIYQQFFGLRFHVVESGPLWDPTVQMIEVRHDNKERSLIGYVIIDLFPRANKFSHACCASIIAPMTFDKGISYEPAVAIVIANFSKSTPTKPSLLKHGEVQTFFHEFGHAIHALLGKAEMATLSGYNTKMDFVEAPSQLLEEWIWDREILQIISCHYLTREPLPEDMLNALIATKEFGKNSAIMGQITSAELSLALYKEGLNKDPSKIAKEIYDKTPRFVMYDPETHQFCSFGHLTGYGPKYYGYQWSKKLALQIFDYIKAHGGLLDPVMGQRYVSKVIGKGGSCDPNLLMDDFLDN
jgi:thimet oligopeptidase